MSFLSHAEVPAFRLMVPSLPFREVLPVFHAALDVSSVLTSHVASFLHEVLGAHVPEAVVAVVLQRPPEPVNIIRKVLKVNNKSFSSK